MLISHRFRFIYLKTRKTAGTSVEIYFSPFCCSPNEPVAEKVRTKERISEWGIVGYRGTLKGTEAWWNHMTAQAILDRIGQQIWSEYFKFCVIRNPFDKVVSEFWFQLRNRASLGAELEIADFSLVRKAFTEWAALGQLPVDKGIFTIQGRPAMDYFVRYERLTADLEQVCLRLGIPWEPTLLGRHNISAMRRKEHFLDYFSPETAGMVREQFAWELEHFDYAEVPSFYSGGASESPK